jgi:chromosome segregation ATPase
MEELRIELNKKDQEILALSTRMKTLEEQHQDYQRHIVVLKESICGKEEQYNMLQADVSYLNYLSFIIFNKFKKNSRFCSNCVLILF